MLAAAITETDKRYTNDLQLTVQIEQVGFDAV